MVVLHTADGKRVPLQATQQQLAHIRTGQHLAVTGSWRAAPTAAAAAAAGAAGAAGRSRFAAASIVASGSGPAAPPPRLDVQPGAGRHLLQSAVVRSTNQLIGADVPTVFIPSEWPGSPSGHPAPDIVGAASAAAVSCPHRRSHLRLLCPVMPGTLTACRYLRVVPLAVRSAGAAGSTCPGSGPIKYTAQQVRAAVFAESNPSGTTVGGLFNKCSFGKTKLTSATSRVVEPVTLPCSGTE